MKKLLILGIAVLLGSVGCSKSDKDQNQVAATPVDTYCLQSGMYDSVRCPGLNGYNSNYYSPYYYGSNPYWRPYNYYNYNGSQYYSPTYYNNYNYGYYNGYSGNYGYGGCGSGYAPVASYYGVSCYYIGGNGSNYYWWNGGYGGQYGGNTGMLVACGIDYTGTCPSGYMCSQSGGLGVCVR